MFSNGMIVLNILKQAFELGKLVIKANKAQFENASRYIKEFEKQNSGKMTLDKWNEFHSTSKKLLTG